MIIYFAVVAAAKSSFFSFQRDLPVENFSVCLFWLLSAFIENIFLKCCFASFGYSALFWKNIFEMLRLRFQLQAQTTNPGQKRKLLWFLDFSCIESHIQIRSFNPRIFGSGLLQIPAHKFFLQLLCFCAALLPG